MYPAFGGVGGGFPHQLAPRIQMQVPVAAHTAVPSVSTPFGTGVLETVVAQCDFRPPLKLVTMRKAQMWQQAAVAVFGHHAETGTSFDWALHPARVFYVAAHRAEVFVFPSGRVVVVATRQPEAAVLALLQRWRKPLGRSGGGPRGSISSTVGSRSRSGSRSSSRNTI